MKHTLESIRQQLVMQAMERGATACDALSMRTEGEHVSWLNGSIEDVGRSETQGVGLRIFMGQRVAYGASGDTSEDGCKALLERVLAMAAQVPEDPYARMADISRRPAPWPSTGWADEASVPSLALLQQWAAEAEAAALAVPGITRSDGAHASTSLSETGLTLSTGFDGAYTHSSHSVSLGVIAGTAQEMERDYASTSAIRQHDLRRPSDIGIEAAERAVARLKPRAGKTGIYPVLFDRRVASSLLRSLSRALSGPRQAKQTSFLNGALGQRCLSPHLTVLDDPLVPYGLRSAPFDLEGCAVAPRTIVSQGQIQSYFLDLRSAARLGLEPTGHGVRSLSSPPAPAPSNLWIVPGLQTPEELMSGMGEGLLVTELMGASISLATGDYSRGASGFWVEGGKAAYPVAELTIAGNLRDILATIMPASDLVRDEGVDSPSLLVPALTIASR